MYSRYGDKDCRLSLQLSIINRFKKYMLNESYVPCDSNNMKSVTGYK